MPAYAFDEPLLEACLKDYAEHVERLRAISEELIDHRTKLFHICRLIVMCSERLGRKVDPEIRATIEVTRPLPSKTRRPRRTIPAAAHEPAATLSAPAAPAPEPPANT